MAELRDASFILPLVHPGTPSSDQYFRNQIPGAMTISFALKIPMFVHEEYRSIAELESASFYYTTENFGKQLEGISLEDYSAKISKMRSLEQFSANAQREKFMRFLVG